MPKLLCVGHITSDTFLAIDAANVNCDLNSQSCKISFDYGSKIPVHDVHFGIGGGAANVVVGTKLLGIDSDIYSVIGKDKNAERISDEFHKYKLSQKNLKTDDLPTDQATILSFENERTIFSYNSDRKFNPDIKTFADWPNVFLSSVGKEVEALYRTIEEAKSKYGFKLFFNPGSKELRYSHSSIVKILESVDYLIANIEEGCALLNPGLSRSQVDIEDLISMLMQKGIKNVVLTDGVAGVYYSNNYRVEHADALKVDVVEKTGAGDAFASGYISAVLHKQDIATAVKWGVLNSANAVTKLGAQNGLLTHDEITKKIVD